MIRIPEPARVYAVTTIIALTMTGAPPPSITNSVGIQLVLIEPGQMQEAVYQPVCPEAPDPVLTPKPDRSFNPSLLWTASDLVRCKELSRRDASPGFSVAITKPFYIGKYEITQAEWTRVVHKNPSVFQGSKVAGDSGRHPVDSVTWKEAQMFVNKLNKMEKTHAYRLPTEFEWEYAGRAGGPGQVDWDVIRLQAVQGLRDSRDGSKPTTRTVGSRPPNAWGLYDMLGNVWEWVSDFYNEKTFPDPIPPKRGGQHVLKGAGFVSDVKNAIYATHGAGPGDGWDVGFRIVKTVEP